MSLDRTHDDSRERCPYLPVPPGVMLASSMRELGVERGAPFYERALLCAQSLWLQGYPAQSLLMINRAMSAALGGDESVLETWPMPYEAAAWVMKHRREGEFIGNPRRHYQHLATRMVEPRKGQRTWRAWACWHLACRVFPDYPADEEQIAREGVREPARDEIVQALGKAGVPGEVAIWEAAAALCGD